MASQTLYGMRCLALMECAESRMSDLSLQLSLCWVGCRPHEPRDASCSKKDCTARTLEAWPASMGDLHGQWRIWALRISHCLRELKVPSAQARCGTDLGHSAEACLYQRSHMCSKCRICSVWDRHIRAIVTVICYRQVSVGIMLHGRQKHGCKLLDALVTNACMMAEHTNGAQSSQCKVL